MIYGYVRVSTDQQDNENQKIGINSKAQQLGVAIDEWIADDGVSGGKEPEDRLLGPLLKRINKGDVIIASEISRLGRKLFMVMRILEHCMKVEAKVYTVKDGYELGDNIQSKVLAFAFGLAAEIERDMIQKRTKEGLENRKRMGVLLGTVRGTRRQEFVTPEKLQQMKQLLEKGKNLSAIARKMDMHRFTVGYHLAKNGLWQGQIIGYKITYANGNIIELTKRNCVKYGLYYKHVQDAVLNKSDLTMIGIIDAAPIFKEISVEIRDYFKISDHPDLDHDMIEKYIMEELTIPEIHRRINEIIDYNSLYSYIQDDTDLSNKYRKRGHLRVKSKRERY